jgi:GT2 family glycosyltransferase
VKISIVIVHWNTHELLHKQLLGLKDFSGEVIVVNNDPTPVRADGYSLTQLRVINNPVNRGFAFACNQGALHASGEWLLFLNPDVHLSASVVQEFVENTDSLGLCASSPESSNQAYQKPVPTFWNLLIEFTFLHRFIPPSLSAPKTLIGGCLCIRRKEFLELGGWNERYFLWFEDSDLTKRMLDQGLPFDRVPLPSFHHQGGASFKTMPNSAQRQIFFISLEQYARVFFSSLEVSILRAITQRFAQNTLLPSDPQLRASIIVPNQKEELLSSFLESNVKSFDFTQDELIIVSSVSRLQRWKERYPEVVFIQLDTNHGFAATVNTGLRRARGTYLGTVNDDTVLSKQWIQKCVSHFDQNVATVTPLICTPDGAVESCGIDVHSMGRAIVHKDLPESGIRVSQTFNGACVLFQRDALEEVGLFDERFHSYLEDIDLGLRMSRKAWKHLAVSDVSITHFGQQTSKHMSSYKHWLDVRNWWLVLLKNFSVGHWIQNFGPILLERARNFSGFLKSL